MNRADLGLNDAAVMADWKRRIAVLLVDALADRLGSVADALRSSWSDEIASADFTNRSDRYYLSSSLEKLFSTNDIDSVELFIEVAPRCTTCGYMQYFRRSIAVEFGVRLLRAALRKEWFVLDPRQGAALASTTRAGPTRPIGATSYSTANAWQSTNQLIFQAIGV
jgi:hypothetical protein